MVSKQKRVLIWGDDASKIHALTEIINPDVDSFAACVPYDRLVDWVKKEKYDLIVVGCRIDETACKGELIPSMIKQIREVEPKIPICVANDKFSDKYLDELERIGATYNLSKDDPYFPTDITRLLQQYIT